MLKCAQCGAPLESSKQACKSCQTSSVPVLPTLAGFGSAGGDDGLKTLLSPRSPADVERQQREFGQTATLSSPLPSVPQDQALSTMKSHYDFSESTHTEISAHSYSSPYEPLEVESDHMDFTISEDQEISLGEDETTVELSKSRSSRSQPINTSTTPPPIPPPAQSIGGSKLKGLKNPFQKGRVTEYTPKLFSLWFGAHREKQKSEISAGGDLIIPGTNKKIGQVSFSAEHFSFGEHFNEEVWRPINGRVKMRRTMATRSGGATVRLVEMTIEETEVISQPAVAVWEVKQSGEQVFYGSFNLFSGISRIGGETSDIALPFVKSPSPLFTIECDLNGDVWCLPNAGHEVWTLVKHGERLRYGSVLAAQGSLFTIFKGR